MNEMKKILSLVFSLTFLPVSSSQAEALEREYLFDCAHTRAHSPLERLNVYEIRKGRKLYYEVDMVSYENGIEKVNTKKVFLLSRYEGKILEFNAGDFRMKIDRVRPNEGYLWAFARVPEYDVHSFDWKCKEQ